MSDAFNIETWLQSINSTSKDKIESYTNIFSKNGFNSLPMLLNIKTDKILETMGISLLAHRLHILKHINLLRSKTTNKQININVTAADFNTNNTLQVTDGYINFCCAAMCMQCGCNV